MWVLVSAGCERRDTAAVAAPPGAGESAAATLRPAQEAADRQWFAEGIRPAADVSGAPAVTHGDVPLNDAPSGPAGDEFRLRVGIRAQSAGAGASDATTLVYDARVRRSDGTDEAHAAAATSARSFEILALHVRIYPELEPWGSKVAASLRGAMFTEVRTAAEATVVTEALVPAEAHFVLTDLHAAFFRIALPETVARGAGADVAGAAPWPRTHVVRFGAPAAALPVQTVLETTFQPGARAGQVTFVRSLRQRATWEPADLAAHGDDAPQVRLDTHGHGAGTLVLSATGEVVRMKEWLRADVAVRGAGQHSQRVVEIVTEVSAADDAPLPTKR